MCSRWCLYVHYMGGQADGCLGFLAGRVRLSGGAHPPPSPTPLESPRVPVERDRCRFHLKRDALIWCEK